MASSRRPTDIKRGVIQMSDVPVELVVAAFTDELGATRALEQFKQAKKEGLVGIRDAAVLTRDANNTLHIKETGDMSGRKGAGVGALIGGAIGLLFPPAVLGSAVIGAGIGGLGAKLRDAGFPDDQLKAIGSSLKPSTSAIVAVIEHTWVEEVQRDLAAQGARTIRQAIQEDIARQLEAGRGVAYVAVADQGTLAVGRLVVDEAASPPTVSESTEMTAPPQ
jgi:uncharacterized membrane protein